MIDTLEIYNDLRESFGEKPATKMAKVIKQIYNELSQAVTKDDFNSLKSIVSELAQSQKELAEAQKRTEARLEELAEAQRRTEVKLEELAEAQNRTQISLDRLVGEHRKTIACIA
jgi:DNA repair exonuclease SbcCD ATPase subunit